MLERTEWISVDDASAIETVVREEDDPAAWVAGPVPLALVDLDRDRHVVRIVGGERDGYVAAASHGIAQALGSETVVLSGSEEFAPAADE